MNEDKIEWTLDVIKKLLKSEIGNAKRLSDIKSMLEHTGHVEELEINYIKEKFKLLQQIEKSYHHDQGRKLRHGMLDIIYPKSSLTKLNISYAFVVLILLFPILVKPYDTYMESYFKRGLPFANFNNEELVVAKWVEKNIPKNYLIYSDLFTVIEFRGLTHLENVPAIGWNQTVIASVKSAMTSENASDAYFNIVSNVGENTLIIITPRTSVWLEGSDSLVQFPIDRFETFRGFDKFFDDKYFTLQYQSKNIFVFTPKHLTG